MIAPGLRVGWLVAPICSRKIIRRTAPNGIRYEHIPAVAYAAVFRNCTISVAYRTVTKTTSRKRDVIVRALNEQLHDKISFQTLLVVFTYGEN